jgi:hypothetical protein
MLRGMLEVRPTVPALFPAPAGPPPGIDLIPGERVLWTGRPQSGYIPWLFGTADILSSAFLTSYLVVSVGWLAWAYHHLMATMGSCSPPEQGRSARAKSDKSHACWMILINALMVVRVPGL